MKVNKAILYVLELGCFSSNGATSGNDTQKLKFSYISFSVKYISFKFFS